MSNTYSVFKTELFTSKAWQYPKIGYAGRSEIRIKACPTTHAQPFLAPAETTQPSGTVYQSRFVSKNELLKL